MVSLTGFLDVRFIANYLNDVDRFCVFLGMYTPQYKWLMNELPKVNRSETPWLIVIMHCPLYSSYLHHYMEGETMRVMYEQYFVQYKVDVVFSGHVHAYERTVSNSHRTNIELKSYLTFFNVTGSDIKHCLQYRKRTVQS